MCLEPMPTLNRGNKMIQKSKRKRNCLDCQDYVVYLEPPKHAKGKELCLYNKSTTRAQSTCDFWKAKFYGWGD